MGELTAVGNLSFGVSLHSHSGYGILTAYKTLRQVNSLSRYFFSFVQWGNNTSLDNYEYYVDNIQFTLGSVYTKYLVPFSASVSLSIRRGWEWELFKRNSTNILSF